MLRGTSDGSLTRDPVTHPVRRVAVESGLEREAIESLPVENEGL